jgi:hypothetical protein
MPPCLRLILAAAVVTAVAGCPGDAPPAPPPDGGPLPGTGLTITWTSQPATIPGQPSSDLSIERAAFLQDELRLVGDAGPVPLDRDQLEWAAGTAPAALPVAGAAPGLYSRLLFELEGDEEGDDEYAYEITGQVRVNGDLEPFTIRDTGELTMSLDFSIMFPAGGSATIPVRIDLEAIVEAVDFSSVPFQNGRYLVEGGSSQLSAVRTAVRGAIAVRGPS